MNDLVVCGCSVLGVGGREGQILRLLYIAEGAVLKHVMREASIPKAWT